jgi:hypothetical protein
MKKLNAKGKRVLVIPDTHAPYHHIDTIRFLKAVKKKYLTKSSLVMHLGDEIDSASMSFHDKDPDLEFSTSSELKTAKKMIANLEKVFPELYLCDSNHGSLVYRRAKKHGLPLSVLKSYQEILETPNWKWYEDYELSTNLGKVYLCHGKSSTYGKLAKEMSCSSVQGHFHGKFEITWHKTLRREIFNCFSGCLVDRDHLAFSYGKNHLPKPILGCTVISKEGYPRLIKMEIGNDNRWTGKLP